jgi:phenylacetate-CoA ligase
MPTMQSDRNHAVARLLSHAAAHSPYYRDQAWAKRLRSGQKVHFWDVPITPKFAVKQNTGTFYSEFVPASEGETIDKYTSGSTGEPSLIKKTSRHFQINALENNRLTRGWGFENQSGVIWMSSPDKDHQPGSVHVDGPNRWTIYSSDPVAIIDLLLKERCSLIYLRPSAAVSILEMAPPLEFLRIISTYSEIVPPELPTLLARYPRCLHYDVYGSIETGIIAGKCRECDKYHLATEHLIFELLDEHDRPVLSGEMGRVIVTPLFNLAMPLLRYDIGDYAIAASDLNCSHSRHGLIQIAGRQLNLFVLPNGIRIMPGIAASDLHSLPIRRYKMIQVSRDEIEFLYVPTSPDVSLADSDVQSLIDRNISPHFRAKPIRVAEIKPAPNGKYLMHENRVSLES